MDKDIKKAFKNLTALGFVQVVNYILPLATLPYLMRILGLEKFGLVSFGQAILLYLIIIPDYGFNITTTRKIALNKADINQLNIAITNTLICKAFLLFISFIFLNTLLTCIPFLRDLQTFFLFGFSIVLGQTFFPMWFFQGVEKLKFITALNLISRLTLTALIFIIIKKPSDYIYVIPVYAIGMLVSTAGGILLMIIKFKIRLNFNEWKGCINELKDGFPIFVSSIATNSYNNASIILVGAFTNQQAVGYFAVADKVLLIFRQSMVVIGQALYPALCRVREEGIVKLNRLLKKISAPLFALTFLACIIIAIAPSFIVTFLTGEPLKDISRLVQLTAFIPMFMLLNTLANQILLVNHYTNISMFIIVIFSIISIIIGAFAVQHFGNVGMLVTLFVTEIGLLISFYFTIKKLGLLKF